MTRNPKSLVSLFGMSREDIESVLSLASKLKKERSDASESALRGKTAVLLFEKPSLRTRVSFEVAVSELGGNAVNLASEAVGMGSRETIADVGRNLERWVHLVVFRTHSHERLEQLDQSISVPLINALTDTYHPCQALAFGQTVREHGVAFGERGVVFIGDGNNVCHSLMILCAHLGYPFTVACAPGYEPAEPITAACVKLAATQGATVDVVNDPRAAVKKAAVVYTDVWASMGQEQEAGRRARDFAAYQVNRDLLSHAPSGTLVSHCLPAHRGEEITDDVLDAEACIAFDEAENRLHTQKAAICHLFS
jgi:ornithine carbamoyltransferase